MNLGITETEFRRRFPGAKINERHPAVAPQKRRHKYGACATSVDGIRFDSKREAGHYRALKLLQQVGEIRWFAVKPVFLLPGEVKYIPDFIVAFHDRVEIQDVKGVRTQAYVIKRRQMKAVYGIEIMEI